MAQTSLDDEVKSPELVSPEKNMSDTQSALTSVALKWPWKDSASAGAAFLSERESNTAAIAWIRRFEPGGGD